MMGALALALTIMGGVMVHAAPAGTCGTTCSTLNVELNGTGSAIAHDATDLNGSPVSADLSAGTVPFQFVVTVVDNRGVTNNVAAQWKLAALSSGVTINTTTSSSPATQKLSLTKVSASCTSGNSDCWSQNVISSVSSTFPLTIPSGGDFAGSNTSGAFGSIDVTAQGNFIIPTGAIGGSYNATITIDLVLS